MRAAIYTRISEDTEGEGLGVARQEGDCRELCQRKGWSVSEPIYEDNDKSAFSGKPRPEYLRLVDDIKNRQVDVIVAWHPDRLHRSPREPEDFVDLNLTGVSVTTCRAGDWDLSTPDGRMTARILGSIARRESEHKSVRITAKHQQLAEKGNWVAAGGRRPFGYNRVAKTEAHRAGIKINPGEAKLIKEAAKEVLS